MMWKERERKEIQGLEEDECERKRDKVNKLCKESFRGREKENKRVEWNEI